MDTIISRLVRKHRCQTSGLVKTIRNLVEENVDMESVVEAYEAEGDKAPSKKKIIDNYIDEWFGPVVHMRPAAYRVDLTEPKRKGEGTLYAYTFHVWEILDGSDISADKLRLYGDWADMEGPHVHLHLVDGRDGDEIEIPGDILMCLMCAKKPYFRLLKFAWPKKHQNRLDTRSRPASARSLPPTSKPPGS